MSVDLGAPAYALLASVCFAASQVTVRRGLVSTSITAGVLISLAAALAATMAFVALDPPTGYDGKGILLFAVAGLAAPGVSRWASSSGIRKLGPSVAVPITQGARPLLAVAGAMLLFGERLTAMKLAGLVAIVVGGWELSRTRRIKAVSELIGEPEPRSYWKGYFRPGVAFPLIAALSYAASDLVVKEGLSHMDTPSFGAFTGMATAFVIWVCIATFVRPVRRTIVVARDSWWLVMSGFLIGGALISLNTALSLGDVTVVSPITASQPLAVFVFSKLLLRSIETIHPSILFGGFSVVIGTVIISL